MVYFQKGATGDKITFAQKMFLWHHFLFVPVQSTEISRDVSGYRTALKYKIFNTVT